MPQEDNTPEPTNNSNDSFTKDEVNSLLAKARQEEKNKLYQRIEKETEKAEKLKTDLQAQTERTSTLESELEKAKAQGQDLQTRLASLESRLSPTPEPKSAEEKIEAQLRENNEATAERMKQIEQEAKNARDKALALEQKLAAQELETLRQKLIAENKLMFPEMVRGSNADELVASARRAAELEKQRLDPLLQSTKEETEKELRSSLSGSLPSPLPPAPDNSSFTKLSIDQRRQLNKIRDPEARKAKRQELLNNLGM